MTNVFYYSKILSKKVIRENIYIFVYHTYLFTKHECDELYITNNKHCILLTSIT